jgi:hypothetical protein
MSTRGPGSPPGGAIRDVAAGDFAKTWARFYSKQAAKPAALHKIASHASRSDFLRGVKCRRDKQYDAIALPKRIQSRSTLAGSG